MTAYYNEFKPEAAHMLRQLIKDGLIAPGEVDERSILEVKPDDLIGFKQCHFFAGIGGWSTALRIAGWPDEEPVWTGSCPCQPFSTAGKQKGKADERHLWPVWFNLIRQCRPSTVFGEQVAAAITHGWWDDVANDMEGENYAVGSAVLPACSVGKGHRRDRLWFVADCTSKGLERRTRQGVQERDVRPTRGGFVGDTEHNGLSTETLTGEFGSDAPTGAEGEEFAEQLTGTSTPRNVSGYVADTESHEEQSPTTGRFYPESSATSDRGLEWIACPDGKSRPVKRGICLLAHGVPNRTPILHAFGNAIVPEVAAKFIEASGYARWQRLGLDLV